MKQFNSILLAIFSLMTLDAFANQKSVCGHDDDRLPSDETRVAIIKGETSANCTLTMIGRSCALTAGHCRNNLGTAEFHLGSESNGNIYQIDIKNSVIENKGIGRDWAVVRLFPNQHSNKYPGDAQGFYEVSHELPQIGDIVRITGHGSSLTPELSYTQQSHTGEIISFVSGRNLRHTVDTNRGNSGSSIILEQTQQVIGIHTHGGCNVRGGSNVGTLIANNERLQRAIVNCLDWERRLAQ